MRASGSRIATAAVAAALIFDSTAGIAASAPAAASPQASQASWLTLSMLSPSAAIGLEGAAVQPPVVVVPPPGPPPPPPPPEENAYRGVPLPVLGIWLAGIALAVYIATRNHHGRFIFPVSPA
jgi:outer membrane biosynthesis protein TonB